MIRNTEPPEESTWQTFHKNASKLFVKSTVIMTVTVYDELCSGTYFVSWVLYFAIFHYALSTISRLTNILRNGRAAFSSPEGGSDRTTTFELIFNTYICMVILIFICCLLYRLYQSKILNKHQERSWPDSGKHWEDIEECGKLFLITTVLQILSGRNCSIFDFFNVVGLFFKLLPGIVLARCYNNTDEEYANILFHKFRHHPQRELLVNG